MPDFRPDAALFLDVDGTLLELVDDPSAVKLDPEVLAALEAIARTNGGAVALVSGRSISQLDRIFFPLRLPSAGLHGFERRDGVGRTTRSGVDGRTRTLAGVRERFERFVAEHPGTLLEDKELSLALHYRRAPEAEAEADDLGRALAAELPGEFRVQPGKMVLEVKPSGATKGTAIAAFMEEPPFRGRSPLFLGDDVTDEDGFRWVNRNGGCSIKVGEGETEARARLKDVDAVKQWLAGYRDYLSREGERR